MALVAQPETAKKPRDLCTSWSEYLRRRSTESSSSSREPVRSRPQESPALEDNRSKLDPSASTMSSPPKRSRSSKIETGHTIDSTTDFDRGASRSTSKLWNPDADGQSTRQRSFSHDKSNLVTHRCPSRALTPRPRPPNQCSPGSGADQPSELLKQPETRPISQEQLIAEVKGIYAGLVMVENKCIEVDEAQSSADSSDVLSSEQWQALVALHRTLLHEHHDFFLASQHPSASPALRRLASKYAMPARMWRHGIHSFLELLRHRLPTSLEHMLIFIYMAYSMMALLYETVPAFEDTWIECLGDLGRYRMAIEDDNIRDREVWTAVSRGWYTKASDKAPTTGRLYHHLAILARPNALQQLYYYTKSLCIPDPFLSARDSIMTLFDPVLAPHLSQSLSGVLPTEHDLVRRQGLMFSTLLLDAFTERAKDNVRRRLLEDFPIRGVLWNPGGRFDCWFSNEGADREQRAMAVARANLSGDLQRREPEGELTGGPISHFDAALSISMRTYSIVLRRFGDHCAITLHRVLQLFTIFSLFAHAFAEPLDPLRIPKIISVGTTAMGSLGASVASWQLDAAEPSRGNVGLRVACSVLVSVFAVLYALFFLTHKRKVKQFIEGICVGGVLCFFFARLVGSSGDDKADSANNGHAIWLDKFNLSALFTIGFGILNAERSLFTGGSPPPKDDEEQPDANDDASTSNTNGPRCNRRTAGHRRRDNEGSQSEEGGLGIDLADMAIGTAAQSMFPA